MIDASAGSGENPSQCVRYIYIYSSLHESNSKTRAFSLVLYRHLPRRFCHEVLMRTPPSKSIPFR